MRIFNFAFFLFLLCYCQFTYSQCFPIDAGTDEILDCNSCTDLELTYVDLRATNTYEVESIPHNPPINYNQAGGTAVSVNIDDQWSGAINLPFPFCFYGNVFGYKFWLQNWTC